MKVEIKDFKPEDLNNMDMRDYENKFKSKLSVLCGASIESKTAFVNGEIYCSWGIVKDEYGHYFWQISSKLIALNKMTYARRMLTVIRDMIKRYDNPYTFCINDDFHQRWMRFIGFKPNKKQSFEESGQSYLMYEAM